MIHIAIVAARRGIGGLTMATASVAAVKCGIKKGRDEQEKRNDMKMKLETRV